MVKLESIVTGLRLVGITGDQSVEVVTTRAYGPNSLEVVWRGPDGFGERIFDRSDEVTLDGAVQRLVEDIAFDYAFAGAFDEAAGTYSDVVDGTLTMLGRFDVGLLVRRSAIYAQKRAEEKPHVEPDTPVPPPVVDPVEPKKPPAAKPRPKRFFAHVNIDAERAGLEVARIMDGLLVELTRERGSTVRVNVEIRGDAQETRYPTDVVDTVKANARDLELDEEQWGFEEE